MPKIDQITAYVMADENEDDEGIPAFSFQGMMMPLVAADPERALALRPRAQELADIAGKPIKIVRFTHMEVVEVIHPTVSKTAS